MPYQAGDNITDLLELVTMPVIFVIHDPRLNIASRIQKKRENGEQPAPKTSGPDPTLK